ncbi:hypothetical protein [Mesorhizobium sp. B2-7-2]|uniref:hypothetical protein n=1 Tax=Mesorhizobium sp. B2-7-2 TaxID=2589908 RepID=UPI0011291AD8|nr:hypothetical protein [Mesorhizobium sp. B2-7-2]TPJ29423.1 hypothetical protein FJ425_09895 [Mesorhizobium sp. B2-7-2]
MTVYDDEIRESLEALFLSGELVDLGDSSHFFRLLERSFPVSGSKIDWIKLPKRATKGTEDDLDFARFFEEIASEQELFGDVIYVGDSLTDLALKSHIDIMIDILPLLIEIPQHHYFIDSEYRWCICLSMEGDMDFGISPYVHTA